jgi:hypothetical protein
MFSCISLFSPMQYHVLEIFCLALCAVMFIKLCFSFMSIFVYFNPHVVNYFFSISLLVQVVQFCRMWACLRYM